VISKQSSLPTSDVRTAFVGCGQIAWAHANALLSVPGASLVGVCDRDEQRAREAAAWSPTARAYQDFGAMLREARPDAVHILTPPTAHAALAIQAMEAGCHVLVEKPMALSVGEADAMIAAAQRNGVKLGTNHNYLYKPSVRRARQLVASGAIGEIVHVNSYYGLSGDRQEYEGAPGAHWSYRLPGGVFTDFLPHLIYLNLAFLGRIESVAGVTLGFGNGSSEAPTEMSALLRGTAGPGTMTISMLAKPYAKFVDIYGTKGIIHADLVREVCTVHQQRRLPRLLNKVLFSMEDCVQLATGTADNIRKVALGQMKNMPELPYVMRGFYDGIRLDREPPASGEQGRRMVELMEEMRALIPQSPAPAAKPAAVSPPTGPKTKVERRIVEAGGLPGKVVVTGASGFLGRHLVAALSRCGADVVALVRDKTRVPRDMEGKAEIVEGNHSDQDSIARAMAGAAIVFHCAAATKNNVPWSIHQETNVDGTRAVLEAALAAGVQRVVHVSSIVVYGFDGKKPRGGIDESTPYAKDRDPWAYYLRSKLEADKLALAFHREQGLPVTVLRPGVIYGPGGARTLGKGLLDVGPVRLTFGSGRNALPFSYVDNVVDALLLASVTPDAVGQAYNIVDEPQTSVRSCALQGAQIAGDRIHPVPVPQALLMAGASVLEGRQAKAGSDTPPRLSRFVVKSACADIRYRSAKARRELGWEPEVSLREGMRISMGVSV
jgi:predicted dehydrogenase/nucleoside-diphosphate-sugar epimerase